MSESPREMLQLDRRQVLRGGLALGGGLVLGLRLTPQAAARNLGKSAEAVSFNAFVHVAPDDTVTFLSKHLEMGQGSYTGLATILAEELDADWTNVRVESAPANAEVYANLALGVQGTGGSTAMANSWMQMRQAGARARAMLVAAAAERWGVPADEITVEKGVVHHESGGRKARFGELAEDAATQTPPEEPKLKTPDQFRLIGTDVMRVDVPEKSDGSARFTLDVQRPDMLTVVVRHPPRFGSTVRSFDASEAMKVDGVVDVLEVPTGIAVFAKGFWPARQGRAKLRVEWDDSAAETRGSDELLAEYRGMLGQDGLVARSDGDVSSAFSGAARVLEADYEFPYLAHAPMEPLDFVIELSDDQCEAWAGSQIQTIDQGAVAGITGLPPENVKIHTLLAGGSFGRRATPTGDIASEASSVAVAYRKKHPGEVVPLKLVWSREDDIQGGRYRPMYVHRLRAGLDADGHIVAWQHHIVGQSIVIGSPFESALVQNGIDNTSVEGASTLPYAIPNLRVEVTNTDVKVPVLWWRSVGHTHTAYSTETFLDDIARATDQDPVELRRRLLTKHPRHAGVLEAVAKASKWGSSLPEGKARGVAVHESFDSFVAQVAEVSVGEGGMPKVEKVYCAVDCGVAINPDVIKAQMEGGLGFGLGAALFDAIHLDDGRVRETNFHQYRPIRMREMPPVETVIVPSAEAPTGVGEPGVPPIAPAVANAWAQLTGQQVRRLPFSHSVEEV